MDLTNEMNKIHRLVQGLFLCLVMLLIAISARASEGEHRLGQGVSFAAGMGVEVSNGNYGGSTDATLVTLPVMLAVNPIPSLDITLEIPTVYLNSTSGSGVVVVTQTGGVGRRRGSGANVTSGVTTATSAISTTNSVSEAGLGDISLSLGWSVIQDSGNTPKIRPTLYLKAPTGNKSNGLGTGTFEGGPGLSFSKWFGDFQLFADGTYIFQDSVSSYQGKNYMSYSAGGGYQITDRTFLSLYAKGSSARAVGGTAPAEGRLKLNLIQSRRISWELYGLAGFTDASPAVGGGLLVMYQF